MQCHDVSDSDISDSELQSPFSPDEEYCDRKGTMERKTNREKLFDTAVPHTELLDTSAAKAKAELANKGSLANRQPPSIKKQSSIDSVSFVFCFLHICYFPSVTALLPFPVTSLSSVF